MGEESNQPKQSGLSYFDSFNSNQSILVIESSVPPHLQASRMRVTKSPSNSDSNGNLIVLPKSTTSLDREGRISDRVREKSREKRDTLHELPSNLGLDSTGLGTTYLSRRGSVEPSLDNDSLMPPESFLEFDSPPPPSPRASFDAQHVATSRLPPIPSPFQSVSSAGLDSQLQPNAFARPAKNINRISMRDSGNYETSLLQTRRELSDSTGRSFSSGASSRSYRNSSVRTPVLSFAGSNSSRGSVLTPSDWRRSSIDSSGGKEEDLDSMNLPRDEVIFTVPSPFSESLSKPRLGSKRSIPSLPLGGLGIEGLEVSGVVAREEEEEIIQYTSDEKLGSKRPIPGRSNSELNWRKLEIDTKEVPTNRDHRNSSAPNSATLGLPTTGLKSGQSLSAKSSFHRDLMQSGSDATGTSSIYFSETDGEGDWTAAEGDEYTMNLLAFGERGMSPRLAFSSEAPSSTRRGRRPSQSLDRSEKIVDRSGLVIDSETSVPTTTTHLLLKHTLLPEWLPSLLTNILPKLSASLIVLDISYCGLLEVPSALSSCTGLQELNLGGNPFTNSTLPSFISSLTSLKVLLADSCQLGHLPSLVTLQKLSTLSIRGNQLRSLPSWLSRLSNLEVLLIDGNPFHSEWVRVVEPILSSIPAEDLTGPSSSRLGVKTLGKKSKSYAEFSGVGGEQGEMDSSKKNIVEKLRKRSKSIGTSPSQSTTNRWLNTTSIIDTPSLPSPAYNKMVSEAPLTPSSYPSTPNSADPSRKWGKIFRKTSGKSESRKVSDPVERPPTMPTLEKKASSTSSFRKRVLSLAPTKSTSTSTSPLPSPSLPPSTDDRISKKKGSFSQSDRPLPRSHSSEFSHLLVPVSGSMRRPTPEQTSGLRGVIAYLRDVDDLSYETLAPPPPLRNSPSLSVVSSTKSNNKAASPLNHTRRTTAPEVVKERRPSFQEREQRLLSQYFEDGVAGTPPMPLSQSVPAASAPSLRLDRKKSDHVLGEIIETEKSYVKVLLELKELYIVPAAVIVPGGNGSKKEETMVPSSERKVVFGNIGSIVDFHDYTFLPELTTAAEAIDDSAGRLAQVFIRHASFLKIYSTYVTTFDAALARTINWAGDGSRPSTGSTSSSVRGKVSSTLGGPSLDLTIPVRSTLTPVQKKRIKSYMKRCRASPSHSQISLEAYLLLPVQRILRYRMLLETLLACTPYVCLDGSLRPNRQIQEALEMISAVANHMNEQKRLSEGKADLLYWQSRISSTFKSPLVQPHRTLIKSGTFTLLRVVKRTSSIVATSPPETSIDPLAPPPTKLIYSLQTETNQQNLQVLLCNDLLVLLRAPIDPSDTLSPVELFTVLRLSTAVDDKPAPASVFGTDSMLRIACDSRAILYVKCSSRAVSVEWMNAINKVYQQGF